MRLGAPGPDFRTWEGTSPRLHLLKVHIAGGPHLASEMWETINLNSLPFLPEGEKENSPGWSAAQSGECPPNNVVRPVGVL